MFCVHLTWLEYLIFTSFSISLKQTLSFFCFSHWHQTTFWYVFAIFLYDQNRIVHYEVNWQDVMYELRNNQNSKMKLLMTSVMWFRYKNILLLFFITKAGKILLTLCPQEKIQSVAEIFLARSTLQYKHSNIWSLKYWFWEVGLVKKFSVQPL